MTEQDDYAPISVTLKGGKGFEAPWIVVRGESAGHVKELLNDVWRTNLGGAVIATANTFQQEYASDQTANPVQAVTKALDGAVVSETPTSPAPSASAPQGQAAAPGPAPTCPHGERVYREGTGAKGKWRAWFCPAPKGTPDQCSPQWVKG